MKSLRTVVPTLSIALATSLSGTAEAKEDTPPSGIWEYPPELPGASLVETYKEASGRALRIWLFGTGDGDGSAPRPAIVFFFGGGWKGGTPGQFYPHCLHLAEKGMVAAVVDYRVTGRDAIKVTDCIADAKSAVRWLRKNAGRLNIDLEWIAAGGGSAGGGSAGGHLAAATALVPGFDDPADNHEISCRPSALILYNPAVKVPPVDDPGKDPRWIKNRRDRIGTEPKAISPLAFVAPGQPPTILFHGTADTAVPIENAREFTAAMEAAGNRCALHEFPGEPHGFFNTGRNKKDPEKEASCRALHNQILEHATAFLEELGWLHKED